MTSRLRELLHELADVVADHLETRADEARYYDQDTSPLPVATHCRLVRTGVLVGSKVSGRVLVEREVMHRFIAEQAKRPTPSLAEDRDALVTAGLKQLGMKRAG